MMGMRHPGKKELPVDNIIAVHMSCLSRGTMHREFMHTLGFFDEHVRHDRDKYIKFNLEGFDHEQCDLWERENIVLSHLV